MSLQGTSRHRCWIPLAKFEVGQVEAGLCKLCTGQTGPKWTQVLPVLEAYDPFAKNLLPLIKKSTSLRRIVSCFTGGKDGPINTTDFDLWKARSPMKARGHMASMVTFHLENLAKQPPDVSFVHDFPGPVRSQIARDNSFISIMARSIFYFIGPFVYMPEEESGERHLFLCTSARFAAKKEAGVKNVPLDDGVEVARGSDGQIGSGVYLPDQICESVPATCEEVLRTMRENGAMQEAMQHTEEQFARIEALADKV